jgi:phosphodiesterase/alkaline phosphatase D-like protein
MRPPRWRRLATGLPSAWGLQVGDVLADRAIIWSRTDRPARMPVEWSCDPRFRSSETMRGPYVLDVTARLVRMSAIVNTRIGAS